MVSIKSCDNTIRYNTFLSSLGTVSLRHGHRSIVEGNYFLGEGKKIGTDGSGGIRVYGKDHKIINNYFAGLIAQKLDAAITTSPNKNNNYYRIKVVSANGEVKYSSIVKVGGTREHEQISVYPNPLKGDVITIQLGGIPDGRYEIQLYSTTGQQMMSASINKLGAVQTQTLDVPKNMSSGVYRLSIRAEDGTIYNKSIIKL